MAVKWTDDQQKVIDSRGGNLLVSAAAGSGKTAVLVERIIQMISQGEHPLSIDQLLVMTFTNAAAAEMRERVGLALEQRLLTGSWQRSRRMSICGFRRPWFPRPRLPPSTASA